MTVSEWINALDSLAWGPVMLILLVGTGCYLTARLGFFQFARFGFWWKNTMGRLFSGRHGHADGEVTPFQAVTMALASTVGTGNIAGVTGAIFLGGPGAVFWMWLAALAGMMTKYAEVLLAVRFRERNEKGEWVGGPMYYIRNGMGAQWAWMGSLFALLASLAAFGIGNAAQIHSIVNAVNNAIDVFVPDATRFVSLPGGEVRVTSLIIGAVVALCVGSVLLGGVRRIGQVTEKMVPVMALLYILVTLGVILANFSQMGKVMLLILEGAFRPAAVMGGFAGTSILVCMQKGIGRGCFSNEAGLGSSPIAHASTSEKEPVLQGLFGIFEVFVDTILITSLTSFTVLSVYCAGGLDITWGSGGNASDVATAMGSVLGSGPSAVLLALCLVLFAFSTMLSWGLYGSRCCEYLLGPRAARPYLLVFTLLIFGAVTIDVADVWNLADALNGFMAIPNLVAVLALSGLVVRTTKEYMKKHS